MDYKKEIAAMLAEVVNIKQEEIFIAVETPKESSVGDYAFPCFRLSKAMKMPPNAIAAELVTKIKLRDLFESVRADGSYLNFFVNKELYTKHVLSGINLTKGRYGSSDMGHGKTIVIDYSSPNVTHEFHIGHLFSTVIGAALYRVFGYLGYKTVGINYVGDWGSQFGKLICGYKRHSSPEKLEVGGIDELTRAYIEYHKEVDIPDNADEETKKAAEKVIMEAREWLVKLEGNDSEARDLWAKFRDICLNAIGKTYKRLGIAFDSYRGESYYNDKLAPIVDELNDKGLLVESEGAKIVDLEKHKMPPCLILRSDGGTLYPSRDIAAAMDRYNLYCFHKSLYVTDMRQSLHFAQFFKVIELMGYEWAKDCVHIPYGLLSLETGALSSRTGNIILLKDLFDESARRALSIINEKNPDLLDKEDVAEDVGVGAVVFGVLFTSRIKDLMFSWEKSLNFDGETGPYVQYTHARANSVLVKSGVNMADKLNSVDFSVLTDDDAMELVRALKVFPERVMEAADKYEPFVISRSLVLIAQRFNKFYHDNPIITNKENVKIARLLLVQCVRDTLKVGLNLLGIKAPERM